MFSYRVQFALTLRAFRLEGFPLNRTFAAGLLFNDRPDLWSPLKMSDLYCSAGIVLCELQPQSRAVIDEAEIHWNDYWWHQMGEVTTSHGSPCIY